VKYKDDRVMHINNVHNKYLLVGLKTGPVEIYDQVTKQLVKRFDFEQMCSSLVMGEFLFIGAMKMVHLLNAHTLEYYDRISTSEWVFSLCLLDDYTLICG